MQVILTVLKHIDQFLCSPLIRPLHADNLKLEDLKVLKRSPDLLNNVKIGHGQLRLIMKYIFLYHILGVVAILVK